MTSLAFGHRDIPALAADIEEDAQPDTILSSVEARERGLSAGEMWHAQATHNPRPPTCIWEERRRHRVENAKELLRADLGFDENDEAEETDESDEEPEVDTRLTHRRNAFISDSCTVSRKRKHQINSDSDSD